MGVNERTHLEMAQIYFEGVVKFCAKYFRMITLRFILLITVPVEFCGTVSGTQYDFFGKFLDMIFFKGNSLNPNEIVGYKRFVLV